MADSSFALEFALRPLDEVQPFTDGEGNPHVHWFALTDGTYDVRLDGQSIFEYSDAARAHFGLPDVAGVDYQVARLFHDLSWTFGDILDSPIPSEVHQWVSSPEAAEEPVHGVQKRRGRVARRR